LRREIVDQNVKKNFVLYKGHTGWKIKTRLFGTLLVSLAAIAISEGGTVVVGHAAVVPPITDTAPVTGNPVPEKDVPESTREHLPTTSPVSATSATPESPATPSVPADPRSEKVVDRASANEAKTYPVLTPGQPPINLSHTDESAVTIGAGQVKDHFTDTVESFNDSDYDPNPGKDKVTKPISDAGEISLTDNENHDFYDKDKDNDTYNMKNYGHQVAHASFEHEIDFNHDFTLKGALGIGTQTTKVADSVGIIFAPGEPIAATKGGTGGNLGLGHLPNAFGFVYDEHYNDGSDTTKVVDPTNQPYFGWRMTDDKGNVQPVTDASQWKKASDLKLNDRSKNPLNDFVMTYIASSRELTITIGGQTFTRKIKDTATGYAMSIAASTGESHNDYSARIDSFTYAPKTASVTVKVVGTTPVNSPLDPPSASVVANVGDTFAVFSTPEAERRALAAGIGLNPDLVTVLPTDSVGHSYVIDASRAGATGALHSIAGDQDAADAYYTYTVTGDDDQQLTVPVSLTFTAEVTPVDAATGVAIPSLAPVQVVAVAGQPVFVQFPGYTKTRVVLEAPVAGALVAHDRLKIDLNTSKDAQITTDEVATPITHYYTATGTTVDGKTVNVSASAGTAQTIADALNGQPLTNAGADVASGSQPKITGDDYYWAPVGRASGADSTDKAAPQDSKSLLVPTKATLDYWIKQAASNQALANDGQVKAQKIYNGLLAMPSVTTARSLWDAVKQLYQQLSAENAEAKDDLTDAAASTDPAVIVSKSQDGYREIKGVDALLSEFNSDVAKLTKIQASAVSFKSWQQVYGTPLATPEAVFGAAFGVTVTKAQLAGLFADKGNFYYVNTQEPAISVTPKDVGTYDFKLTAAGQRYLKNLTPDNPDAGLYAAATVTITPAAAEPTIQDATVVYGGNGGRLPEITGSLGTKVSGADTVLTPADYEVVDAAGKPVPVNQLQAGGDYTIRFTTQAQKALKADKNYAIASFGTAKLRVTRRQITVTAQASGKAYGSADPTLRLTSDAGDGLVNGDSLDSLGIVLSREDGEDVGKYAIKLDRKITPNYTIKFIPGTFTITAANRSVTIDQATMVYGSKLPAFVSHLDVLKGAIRQADFEVVGNGTSADPLAAGQYQVRLTSAVQEQLRKLNPNYALKFVPASLTVVPRVVAATIANATMTAGDAKLPGFTATITLPGTVAADHFVPTDFEIIDKNNADKVVGLRQLQANNTGRYRIRLTAAARAKWQQAQPNYALNPETVGTLTVNQRRVASTVVGNKASLNNAATPADGAPLEVSQDGDHKTDAGKIDRGWHPLQVAGTEPNDTAKRRDQVTSLNLGSGNPKPTPAVAAANGQLENTQQAVEATVARNHPLTDKPAITLPQTGENREDGLVALGLLFLAGLVAPFRRKQE